MQNLNDLKKSLQIDEDKERLKNIERMHQIESEFEHLDFKHLTVCCSVWKIMSLKVFLNPLNLFCRLAIVESE